jgi:hypothetical protein
MSDNFPFVVGLVFIPMKPMSYDLPYRQEASDKATELGLGLRMELGNVTTRFYGDPSVEVGKVSIYAAKTYSGMPEYVTTLESAAEEWTP